MGLKEGDMNLCAILVNCRDYSNELSSIFTRDDSVLDGSDEKLMDVYGISDAELQNLSVEEIIIDRITKLTVDM